MMRQAPLILALFATALHAQETRDRVHLPGYRAPFPIEEVVTSFDLDAPRDRAYEAVKASFAQMGVPLDVDVAAKGIVGNNNIKVMGTFAGYRLSRIVDCGMGTTGANADSYRVSLVFVALLDSTSATQTKLRVGVVGGAEPLGRSGDGVQCGSTGILEAKLVEIATARLK